MINRFLAVMLALGLLAACCVKPGHAEGQQPFMRNLPGSREQIQLSFAPLVKQTAPAVVNVYAKTIQRQQTTGPFDDPIFRQFFGDGLLGPPRERVANSLGSGVIVDSKGVIVTNNHVIRGATDIRVALADKREFPAKLMLADERTDIAILRIDVGEEILPRLALGNSDNLEVGDLVLAIGNPFGVGQTVTSGIVSGLSRTDVGRSDYQSFIQTDAAINPGNSGGALVNLKGELVGINSMIFSKSGGSIGLGFAIPSNLVSLVVQSAETGTKIVRPWFGGEFQNVSQDIADSLGLARPEGVLVVSLDPESPLAKAGIRRGDVLLAMDGKSLDNAQELNYLLGLSHVGDDKLIEFKRGSETKQVSVALIAAPETVQREETTITGQSPLAGVVVANLSPAVADELGLDGQERGVVVTKVQDGPAQQFLAKGDLLREVNGVAIESVDVLRRVLQKPGRGWVIGFERNGQKVYLRLG
jgi:Do/DeqQ family serine protease